VLKLSVFGLIFVSLFCLLSCGLEDFSYIDYVPEGNYRNVNQATVRLPSDSADGYRTYFTNFIIYYRIYITGITPYPPLVDTDKLRRELNETLYSDWVNMSYLTDITSTTVSTSNLENTFNTRKYYKLELQTTDGKSVRIDNVLSNGIGTSYPSSLGKTLTIDFPTQGGSDNKPTLRLDNETEYVLLRANSGQGINFNPLPKNGYFQNDPDLYDNANAYSSTNPTPTVNADTMSRTPTQENLSENRYTYVSMYIAAAGINYLTAVYSQPTFLGIFRLPDSFF
jgi:hypothetical protein